MSWRDCSLGDAMTLKRGHDLPNAKRNEGDVPVVSSSGITGYHNESKASAPGVVTGRYGTLGEVFYVEKDYWPLNTALYVTDFKGNNPRFVSYFLRSILRNYQSDKAAVPGVNRNVLHKIPVRLPDGGIQKQIVGVLSAYDDFIENNRRRIQLLEQATRLLYKEWFVHLRFPGHEHIKIKDGVPVGWEKKALSELCSDIREPVNPKDVAPETAYIGLEHIPRRSITLDSWGVASEVSSGKSRFSEGDILFGKIRPYFHKVGFALVDGIASSDAIVIRPIDAKQYHYVLFLVSSDEFVALASQTVREGSKMPRADWKYLLKSGFKIPPKSLLKLFEETVAPICDQLKTLAINNRKLSSARDLLLPRLMNGELIA
ncbi:MAG TPA: restriction endonuclease subunit S [Gammaproteobacteria bacterium]|nr:restriction endonuclease subunit S [Gammaproteobacteria bacterium]